MTQNVDRILARGERLDDLMDKSEDLQAGVSVTATFLLLYIIVYVLGVCIAWHLAIRYVSRYIGYDTMR